MTAKSTPSASLARLLAPAEAGTLWSPGDLAAMLRHQLATPLGCDLPRTGLVGAERLADLCAGLRPPVVSVRDLLVHPGAPLELLQALKEFAKISQTSADHPLPEALATAVYFLAIAAGVRRGERQISSLPDRELRDGLTWCLAQAGLDAAVAAILQQALARLDAERAAGSTG